MIEIDYCGNRLKVTFDASPSARLFINGIQRAEEFCHETTCVIQLTSTLQTDYEWHEFVEATFRFSAEAVLVEVTANRAILLTETHSLSRSEGAI